MKHFKHLKHKDGLQIHRFRRRKKGLVLACIATFMVVVTGASCLYVVNRSSTPSARKTSTEHVKTADNRDVSHDSQTSPIHSVASEVATKNNLTQDEKIPPDYGISLGDTLQGMSDKNLNSWLEDMHSLGVRWIRIDLSWQDIQPVSMKAYSWSSFDKIVSAADAHGLSLLPIVGYTPQWARQAQCADTEKCAPADVNQFATFAKVAAQRYSNRGIHTWEIWNEPNLASFWQPIPSPSLYAKLLIKASSAIKSVDTSAKIISGSLAPLDDDPNSIQQLQFLKQLYQAGAKDSFDAVGSHPYSYPALPDQVQNWSGWSQMSALPVSYLSVMNSFGDTSKPIWITEFGAPTNGPGELATAKGYDSDGHPDHVTEQLQATMMTQALQDMKSMPRVAALFWYTYKDQGTDTSTNENFFGLLRANGYKKPAYYALKQDLQ